MGNSNSHLATSRFTPSIFHGHQRKDGRISHSDNAIQSSKNRVLPAVAVDQQRLRSTDNGSILQNGGTISGRKSTTSKPLADTEFLRLLQNKCKMVHPGPQNESFVTLYGHRKSHSDPDIVRKMMMSEEEESDGEDDDSDERFPFEGNAKSIIAVSPSKAKIKSRKKNRAPEPPQSNTLPKSLDRVTAMYSSPNAVIYKKNVMSKTPRRPLPPIPVEEFPPPVPPPPDYNGVSEERSIVKMPSKNYEKNKRVVDRWKLTKMPSEEKTRERSKSLERSEDQRSKDEEMHHGFSRFTRNASVKDGTRQDRQETSVIRKQFSESALNEAIVKMERRKHEKSLKMGDLACCPVEVGRDTKLSKNYGLSGEDDRRYYYFTDMNASRRIPQQSKEPKTGNKEVGDMQCRNDKESPESKCDPHLPHKPYVPEHIEDIPRRKLRNNEGPHRKMQRMSRKVPMDQDDPKLSKWRFITNESMFQFFADGGVQSNSTSSEEEIEIDLQLRPTLPKRPLKVPHFSPADAWKSINFDFFKDFSRRSDVSSDDGDDILEEKILRVNRPVAPRRVSHHRSVDSGISPDAGSPMFLNDSFEALLNPNPTATVSPSQEIPTSKATWIPQHDLAGESDSESENSSPEQVQKSTKQELQAKFSMPNLMFPSKSLPRTEHTVKDMEEKLNTYEKGRSKHKRSRKHRQKNGESQHFNSLRNLKKALGIRGKSSMVDESKELDSNWSLSQSLPNFVNNLDASRDEVSSTERKGSPSNSKGNISEFKMTKQLSKSSKNDSNFSLQQVQPQRNGRWRNAAFVSHPTEGHIIYLPQYSCQETVDEMPRFCEEAQANTDSELVVKKKSGRKKFSYQSTVRQEEKKKLEKQAAKEVEESERKRQQEIEWMNKVEEEFRKQRDKEKVNIRHQLRIFHLQNKATSSSVLKDRNGYSSPGADEVRNSLKSSAHSNPFQDRPPAFDKGSASEEPPTGMRKWLRRQNGDHSFSFKRPEPEGGRSSSDDSKHADWRGNVCSKHSQDASSGFIRQVRSQSNVEAGHEFFDRYADEPSGMKNAIHREGTSSPTGQTAAESQEYRKASSQLCGHQKPWKKANLNSIRAHNEEQDPSPDEYEYHMKLSRTNSGRTYESHSYYILERRQESEGEILLGVQNSGNGETAVGPPPNLGTEIKENLRKKTREFDRRSKRQQASNEDSEDSGSENRDRTGSRFRNAIRIQRKSRPGSNQREPSFSRNHPHRNGARGKFLVNGKANHHQSGPSFGPQEMPSVLS